MEELPRQPTGVAGSRFGVSPGGSRTAPTAGTASGTPRRGSCLTRGAVPVVGLEPGGVPHGPPRRRAGRRSSPGPACASTSPAASVASASSTAAATATAERSTGATDGESGTAFHLLVFPAAVRGGVRRVAVGRRCWVTACRHGSSPTSTRSTSPLTFPSPSARLPRLRQRPCLLRRLPNPLLLR